MIETQKTEAPDQTSMRNDWLTRYSKVMARLVPDAISTVAIMVVLLFGLALALGNSFTTTLDAWYRGLWMLLPFTMQITGALAWLRFGFDATLSQDSSGDFAIAAHPVIDEKY